LDSEDPPRGHEHSNFSEEQLAYFRDVLKRYPKNRWTVIFVHKPLWESDHPSWLAFEEMVADRDYTVFGGHAHSYAMTIRKDRKYFRLGLTGGILPSNEFEKNPPDQITWITMSEQGPIIANIFLSGILDEQTAPALPQD
jgi:hypothetical protein